MEHHLRKEELGEREMIGAGNLEHHLSVSGRKTVRLECIILL